jgi:hypothetical protein
MAGLMIVLAVVLDEVMVLAKLQPPNISPHHHEQRSDQKQ